MIARANRCHLRATIFLISKYWSFLHIAYLLWHGHHIRPWCVPFVFCVRFFSGAKHFHAHSIECDPQLECTVHTLTLISGRANQVNFQLLKNTWRFRQDNINYNWNIVIRTQRVFIDHETITSEEPLVNRLLSIRFVGTSFSTHRNKFRTCIHVLLVCRQMVVVVMMVVVGNEEISSIKCIRRTKNTETGISQKNFSC